MTRLPAICTLKSLTSCKPPYASKFVVFLLGLALAGLPCCSNQALYKAIQQNRLQECETRPVPQQETCKAAHQQDYEEYRRERDSNR